ncbi:hypothetical protein, conserved [Babesia bigemina]|uniref:Uncharacterized protein n=1 Tax=Babesia bigemina TaxID=5866 RepID=A0A061DBM5_BABBI|nr:hypothetical protein, conserved [Babesia bigemina]CDR95150.1 hypothetical protein, conserved [Babesia bigemina]|eukprot:XP_012767336.1 hypothetical protein, conserved [Babesia bigemina]
MSPSAFLTRWPLRLDRLCSSIGVANKTCSQRTLGRIAFIGYSAAPGVCNHASVPNSCYYSGSSFVTRRHLSGEAPSASKSSDADDSTAENTLYATPGSAAVFSDIGRMDSLSPRQLRVLLEDAVTARVSDPNFWAKASSCAMSIASQFKFFDTIRVLECFAAARLDDRALVQELVRNLTPQVHRMEPRHYIQTIDVFGRFGRFPEQLFMEVFYGLMRDAEKLYGSEYAELFLCLSRWEIRNPQLLSSLCRALCTNISLLRYHELCQVASCARTLEVADTAFYMVLDEWQRKELQMLTIQELLDAAKRLRTQEITWAPYDEALRKEFVRQTKEVKDAACIDQLADPFDCLNFLRLTDSVSKEFLLALTKWCEDAAHRPPTRSQKRPESHDLVHLYNLVRLVSTDRVVNICSEYNVDSTYLDKAILKFVTSKGGLQLRTPKPIATQYKPNRKYVHLDDPANPGKRRPSLQLAEGDLESVEADEAQTALELKAESEHISQILDDLEPLPRGIDFKKPKKVSTQSCGKASFRLKPKTFRHKNVAATQPL